MFVKIHVWAELLHVNLTDKENLLENISSPLKRPSFHAMIIPPEAPIEERNSNLLNLLGQNLLMYDRSNFSLFVSCKQRIPASLSSFFCLIASHLLSELIPLMF